MEETTILLEKAVDNSRHENIYDLTFRQIEIINRKALFTFITKSQDEITKYLALLNDYVYVSTADNFKAGAFLRWFKKRAEGEPPEEKPQPPVLTKGSFLMETKITDKGILLVFKNFKNRYYSVYLDDVVLFQKLSDQELVILLAMDYV